MSNFYFLTRTPLTCLIIIIAAVLMFQNHRHTWTASYNAFLWMIIFGTIHVVFAILTEYTVNNRDTVSATLNEVLHDVFFISLTFFMAMFLNYALLLIEKARRKEFKAFRYVVYILATICAILEIALPFEYVDAKFGSYAMSYSTGYAVFAHYFYTLFTVITCLVLAAGFSNKLKPAKRVPMFGGLFVLVACSAIQCTFPYLLITSIGVTTIIVGTMLSLENKQQYLLPNSTLYNASGNNELIKELLMRDEDFQLGVYAFAGNPEQIMQTMLDIQNSLPQNPKLHCCALNNMLVIVPASLAFWRPTPTIENLPQPKEVAGMEYSSEVLSFHNDHSLSSVLSQLTKYRDTFLENAHHRDELTETLGRTTFINRVEKFIAEKQTFTFLMMDLDNFKLVNDTYGHQAGDEALQKMAETLRETLRSTDLICRMGGDEFAVAMPGLTDTKRINEIANKLRVMLATVETATGKINLTYSMGACVVDFDKENCDEMTFRTLYADADNALYQAKSAGKSCLVFFGGGDDTISHC